MEALIRPIALLLTAALAACAGQPAANQKASQFGDIPVPDGMTFQEGPTQSNSYEAGGFRYADLRYYGNLSVAEVARFMKKGMGRHGWELESAKDVAKRRGISINKLFGIEQATHDKETPDNAG